MQNGEDDSIVWKYTVGAAVLGFGDIEMITIKCLTHLPSDKISDSTSTLPFSRRVNLLIEILEGREEETTFSSELILKLKRALELAEVRNVIAHNPLVVEIYKHKTSGDLLVERLIKAERKKIKAIDLPALKEFAAEVEDLASDLYMLISKNPQVFN